MTVPQHLALVVDDEPQIRQFLVATLAAAGFRTAEADSVARAIAAARSHKPDVMLLDLGLPDGDGVEVVRAVRAWSALPIIVLSARIEEKQKIAALDAGTDDYVTKPTAVGELLARVRVALRHGARPADRPDSVLLLGDRRVDLARRTAHGPEGAIHLTPIEFKMLALLARHAGLVVTQRQLLREVWGPSHVEQPHYLRVYMKQLRAKLEPDPARPRFLQTEIGVGYRLIVDDEEQPISP